MKLQQIVDKLRKEISTENRKDVIYNLEEILSENFKELSVIENFFQLPLKYILSVISKISFDSIDESDNIFEILQNFVKNTIASHFNEKETIMLLQNIDIEPMTLSFENTFMILELFTNCHIIQHFCCLYNEKQLLPEIDYDYEIKQKNSEIEILKQQNMELQLNQSSGKPIFYPITEKPKDFEPNIFKACKEGKLTSVQWLIEKENIDKNKRVENEEYYEILRGDSVNNTPIHIASINGHLLIVQYLVEKQNVDSDIKGNHQKTPLQYACEQGYFQIVKYFLSKGVNYQAIDEYGDHVIHYASKGGLILIVKFLIEKRNVDKDIKGRSGSTPLHYACTKKHLHLVQYLISKGANVNAKTNCGLYVIHSACRGGSLPIIQYLIEKQKVNINIKGARGKTPLHIAAIHHYDDVINYLISKGADKNAKDDYGTTPFTQKTLPIFRSRTNQNVTTAK